MKHYKQSLLLALVILSLFIGQNIKATTIVKIGDEVIVNDETAHPYSSTTGLIFEKEYFKENAGYVRIHFTDFSLAEGDFVEIEDMVSGEISTYKGKGKHIYDGSQISSFWSKIIHSDHAIVRLISNSTNSEYGFNIDKVAYGYSDEKIDSITLKSICGTDDKEWAQCYMGTTMYEKAKTVCRLFMNGNSAGTGWLIGSEGHIMTNNHVIPDQATANNTEYEFMGEGACGQACDGWLSCRGTIEAYSGELVKTNTGLDYSLVKLAGNLSQKYGYLQLRNSLPAIGERIYIPQHPGAKGKQISVVDDQSGGYSKVDNINSTDVQYFADTEGGSSGSPVIAYSDNLVVALHHYGGCMNAGVRIPFIINDLGSSMPLNGIGGVSVEQSPYAGVISIPGTVEMENYDNGGEGVAYHDADGNNKSNVYRYEGVDIEACSEGGYNIDWSVTGEWLEYTVNILYSGTYKMDVRIASPIGGSYHVEFDGVNVSGTQTVPNTGGWQNWQTVSSEVSLSAGQHIMRFFINAQEFNTNKITFTYQQDPLPTGEDITNLGGTISTQYNDSPSGEGNTNLIDNNVNTKYLTFNASAWLQFQSNSSYVVTSYTITSANDAAERDPRDWTLQASNDGANWTTLDSRSGEDFPNRYQTRTFSFSNSTDFTYYRFNMNNNSGSILQLAEIELFGDIVSSFAEVIEAENYVNMNGIDVENCSEGGQNVGWIDAGDWMVWDIDLPNSGQYKVEYRVASPDGGGSIQFEQAGGGTIFGTINVPSTGGWQNWTTISHNANLNAGAQQVAIYVPAGGYNINWFKISQGSENMYETFSKKNSKFNKEDIYVYPNPTSGLLFIEGAGLNASLAVYNTIGQKVKSGEGNYIDVNELSTGFYTLIIINTDNSISAHKFIKN